MKTWTMPRIKIEAFSANEYVAVCMSSGSGTFVLECDNAQAHNIHHDQYQDTGHYCDLSISLPNGVFSGGREWWYDSDGNHAERMAGSSYPSYGDYNGRGNFTAKWVYHFEKIEDELVWHVYENVGRAYTSADGYHVSYISGNPAS